VKVEVVPFW